MVEFLTLLVMAEPSLTLTFQKPSPCYRVDFYEVKGKTLNIHLTRPPSALCPQVITEDRITLEGGKVIRRVRVFVNGRLWWETSTQDK